MTPAIALRRATDGRGLNALCESCWATDRGHPPLKPVEHYAD